MESKKRRKKRGGKKKERIKERTKQGKKQEEQMLKRSILATLTGLLCSHLPYIINQFKSSAASGHSTTECLLKFKLSCQPVAFCESIIIIIIINLIYIAQFDTNGILTALYIVITYIQMQYVHVCTYAEQSYKYTYTCLHIHTYTVTCTNIHLPTY